MVPDVVGLEVHVAREVARGADLFLEHQDPDGRPLDSGTVVVQQPASGQVVARLTRIVAWVSGEGPPFEFFPEDPDDSGGGPSGGVREPRRPLPGSGTARLGLTETDTGS